MSAGPSEVPATPTCASLQRYFRESTALAAAAVHQPASCIEDLWLSHEGQPLHLDWHRPAAPGRGVVVLQPGVGSYGRFYAPLGQALARAGWHMLAIDRPGHGFSAGARGDCTVGEALAVSAQVLDWARAHLGGPVVLMGSSLGGLLTGFALLAGQRPDLAVIHNFVVPGRLVSMRLRARLVLRWRRHAYDVAELANGFKGISEDAALLDYLRARGDPQAAWSQSVRAVASLFAHNPARPRGGLPPVVALSGGRDRQIPAWATRAFLRWAGLRPRGFHLIPGAGHMLFHDHLAQAMPVLLRELESV